MDKDWKIHSDRSVATGFDKAARIVVNAMVANAIVIATMAAKGKIHHWKVAVGVEGGLIKFHPLKADDRRPGPHIGEAFDFGIFRLQSAANRPADRGQRRAGAIGQGELGFYATMRFGSGSGADCAR